MVGLGLLKVFWNRKTQRFTKRRRFRPFLPIQVCGKLPSHLLRAMEEKKIFRKYFYIFVSDLFLLYDALPRMLLTTMNLILRQADSF